MQKYVVLLVFVLKIINEFFVEARFIEIKTTIWYISDWIFPVQVYVNWFVCIKI